MAWKNQPVQYRACKVWAQMHCPLSRRLHSSFWSVYRNPGVWIAKSISSKCGSTWQGGWSLIINHNRVQWALKCPVSFCCHVCACKTCLWRWRKWERKWQWLRKLHHICKSLGPEGNSRLLKMCCYSSEKEFFFFLSIQKQVGWGWAGKRHSFRPEVKLQRCDYAGRGKSWNQLHLGRNYNH